jgi:hypothetical protein
MAMKSAIASRDCARHGIGFLLLAVLIVPIGLALKAPFVVFLATVLAGGAAGAFVLWLHFKPLPGEFE